MLNPWVNLKKTEPFILEIDKEWVNDYQEKLSKKANKLDEQSKACTLHLYGLRTDDVPFPYYGNPNTARVVVLQANPGYDLMRNDRPFANEILDLDYRNLLHKVSSPLYTLLPRYREWVYTNGKKGTCWYWKRTRHLREKVDLDKMSSGMMYMELFPYRSVELLYPKTLPPSQEYTFNLLRQLLKKNVLVIMTRKDREWEKTVPELKSYHKIIKIKNHRNIHLSPNILGQDGFQSAINALES